MEKATLIPIEKVREESKKYQYPQKKPINSIFPKWSKNSSYTICLTGKLESMTRKEARDLLERNGHTFRSGVSQMTDYLVIGKLKATSKKLETANLYGVKMLSEKEFREMMA